MQSLRPIFILLLVQILAGGFALSQDLPEYPERLALTKRDTSAALQLPDGSTDGSVSPQEYILGPGDKLFLSIRGLEEFTYTLPITLEGSTYIPKAGGVVLAGLSLIEGKKAIEALIRKNFKDVQVFISLIDFRRVKVSFYGGVNRPSTYTMVASARLSDLIMYAGGISRDADLRNIRVTRKNGTTITVDLLTFIRKSDRSQNPLLQEGDYVFVPRSDRIVWVSGAVMFPGVYEFREGESVARLIELCGGFLQKAKIDTIEIIRFKSDRKTQASLFLTASQLSSGNTLLENRDKIIVREISKFLQDNTVMVTGFVKYGGYYKIEDNRTTLREVLLSCGGFLDDASLEDATLIRDVGDEKPDPEFERLKQMSRADMTDDEYDYFKSRSRQRKGRVVVDFSMVMANTASSENIPLRRGDVLYIPAKKDYITIIGQVVTPGNIVYRKELSVQDYINLAGGYAWRAIESEVRVIKVNTGEWIEANDIDELQPGDTIWVPEDPPPPRFWDVATRILTVLGQVATVIAATVAVVVSLR